MKHEFEKAKDMIRKMNFMLSGQQKRYGVVVFIGTLLAAALEMLGVSVILPIVEGLTDIGSLFNKWYLQPFIKLWSIDQPQSLIYLVCGEVILVYIFKNLYFIFYSWLVKKYTYKIKRELGVRVMESYMMQGYIFFVNNNSSRLLQGISGDISAVNTIINSVFNLLTKVLTIVMIGMCIIIMEPYIALLLLILSFLCIFIMQFAFKNSMNKYGMLQRIATWNNVQAGLEAIHGSKEVLVTKRQEYFTNRYRDSIAKQSECNIKIEMASVMPSYLIEMICITGLLLVVAAKTNITGSSMELIGSLAVIAVSAFRILPAVGAVTSTLNVIQSNMPAFNAAYDTIKIITELAYDQENRNAEAIKMKIMDITLKKEIVLSNIYYKYPETENYILENVSLTITAKESIGIIGPSGAGKSTFVDVLLGLLIPEKGTIKMDGIDIQTLGSQWNRNIGYVPQNIYLVDNDIRSNIAFGIPQDQIDDGQVWKVLEMAQLAEFVRNQPQQLDTRVGEWGIKFSGGQRQRVAIARALYGNPEILVLDEATAALDSETESALMEAIEALQGHKTLIVVAHRLTTIKKCDLIYEVKDGKIIARNKEDIFAQN